MIVMRGRMVVVALAGLTIAGCAAGPSHLNEPPVSAATSASETDAAFDLLMQGDKGGARKRLKAILKRDPMNASALLLSESISRDPKDLLGSRSYPYTVRSGDTIVGLAKRYLGNRLKAYQLLRFNALKAPVMLTAGQILRLPGEPPRPEPAPPPKIAAPVIPTRPKPVPAAPSANPAAARQLRTAGLAALNQGAVDRAVGLLRRASQLDPGNPLIARDLARAERIAATVRSKK